MTAKRPCIDCGKTNAVPPKRLCPTCTRAHKKASAEKAHARRVEATYGISAEDYELLLKASGGRCFICGSRGGRKRLAVDHDHTKEGRESVRGLTCTSCNHYLLGKVAHDDPDRLEEIAIKAVQYLRNPPAQSIFKSSI